MPGAPINSNFMMQEIQNSPAIAPTMATHENHSNEMESESSDLDSNLEQEEGEQEGMELNSNNAENNNLPEE